MISLFQQHVAKWKNCTKCSLHHGRQKVVIADGTVPCDILFIGEAPGESEDCIGRPFVGPAGKLLRDIIRDSGVDQYDWAMTNIVCCIPRNDMEKATEPGQAEIVACQSRLIEFVRICQPKMIVLVGALAKRWVSGQNMFKPVDWIPEDKLIHFVEITHPEAIIRSNIAQQGLAIQRCVVRLKTALHERPDIFQLPGVPS